MISVNWITEIANTGDRVEWGVGRKLLRILLNYWFTKSRDSKSLFCYLKDLQVLHNKRSFKQQDWCFKLGNSISIKVTLTVWLIQIQGYCKQSGFTFQDKWQVFFYMCLGSSQKPCLKCFIIYCCFLEMKGTNLFICHDDF